MTTAVRPRSLTDDELVKFSYHYLDTDGTLTKEFQEELIRRFADFIKY